MFILGEVSLQATFESIVNASPFVCIKVTAHSSHGEEGGGAIWGTVVLQEARHVQSEVHRPGEVVWVCVHPANYLKGARKTKKTEKERARGVKDRAVRAKGILL